MTHTLARGTSRAGWVTLLTVLGLVLASAGLTLGQADPLPSWSDGAVTQSLVSFVQAVTDAGSPRHVPREARIAEIRIQPHRSPRPA